MAPVKNSATKTIKKKKLPLTELGYQIYIRKIAKGMNDDEKSNFDCRISKNSVVVMDNMMKHVFQKIVDQAAVFCRAGKRQTIMDKDIEAAIDMLITGSLRDQLKKDSQKAVKAFKG